MHPLHHQHLRKRQSNRALHSYPSRKPLIRFFDMVIIIGGVIGPFISLPQLYKVWIEHNTGGLSALTWGGYSFLTALWLEYGLLHREKAIIVSQTSWLVFNLAIFLGILIN